MTDNADDRFLDLLDMVASEDDYEDDPYMTFSSPQAPRPSQAEGWTHGPLQWSIKCSVELQDIVDTFNVAEMADLQFSVTVADPRQADCPLVACSSGFSDLTGYYLQEIVGRNCRFLLNGVPPSYINEQTRFHARDFCVSVTKGLEYDSRKEVLPDGIKPMEFDLPSGELICVQTNAMKTGELFRNMFYLKHVWLDDSPFILGLQAGIPEEYEEGTSLQELQKKCNVAWGRLGHHMSAIEQVLAAQFWYSASMRRQDM